MREKHGLLYRAINKVLLSDISNHGCDCELPGGGTDCCSDLGACCYRSGTIPGGPLGSPGSWVCVDGVTSRACRDGGGRTGGFGSRCLPVLWNDKSCPMTAGGHGVWTCCGSDGQCLMPAAYANTSMFKCKCKRRGGICRYGNADYPGSCSACEGMLP